MYNERSLLSKDTQHKPWMIHFNCRSLLPHIHELRLIFTTNHLLVITISEQHCYILEVHISGYQMFPLDRSHGHRGGGVAIYLLNENGLKFSRRCDLEYKYETLWLQFEITKVIYFAVLTERRTSRSRSLITWMMFYIKPPGTVWR